MVRRNTLRSAVQSTEGQVILLFALFSVVLVGFMALVVDVGYLMSERRQLQSATDAAALAGARTFMDHGRADAAIKASAQAYLQENADSATGDTDITGDREYGEVKVTADQPVDSFFLNAIYSGDWEVGTTSVAAIEWGNMKSYALVALDPDGPGIHIGGDSTIKISGQGSAISNSNVTKTGAGSGSNDFNVGGSIDAVGTIDEKDSWDAPGGINEHQSPATDPIERENIPAPDPSTLDPIDSKDDAVQSGSFSDCDNTCTLKPGYYEDLGKLTIKGVATMEPGIYYFDGTSIALQNTDSTLNGDDVLLYFGGSDNDTKFEPGNGNVKLTTTGSEMYPGGLEGMVIWIENGSDLKTKSSGEFIFEGVLYAPDSHVELYGAPDAHGFQVIAGDVELQGSGTFDIKYEEWIEIDVPGIFLIQ